jgi:chromosome partitioning protein
MIIVVGGIKGGSGKTTVATNLAVMRSSAGIDLLLVDADSQETASDFSEHRSERLGDAGYTSIRLIDGAVRTQIPRLAEKYQDIIIDTGGRDSQSQRWALARAGLLLVPFVPRSFDIWTMQKVSALVEEMRTSNPDLKAWTFLNRADARGQDNGDAAHVLREMKELEFVDVMLGTRKAFANAAAEGLAVHELKNPDSKAIEEIGVLYQQVFGAQWEPNGHPGDAQ